MNKLLCQSSVLMLILLVANLSLVAQSTFADPKFSTTEFSVPHAVQRLVSVDLNSDGLNDLVMSDGQAIYLYLQTSQKKEVVAAPFDFSKPSATLELDAQAVGWSVFDKQVVALVDGKKVLAWSWQQGDASSKESSLTQTLLLDNLDGFLPPGVYPSQFVQDINGDGRQDFVVPSLNALSIYLQKTSPQNQNTRFSAPLSVRSQTRLESRLRVRNNINVLVGQQVVIPQLSVRDVNNDNRNDLIVLSDEWLEVFLADTEGGYPVQPSYALDRKEIEARVGEVDYDNIDYGNLSGLLAHTYEFRLQDVNKDNIDDLIVREGGRVIVYGGTPNGMVFDKPRQVLKSAGNVLGISLRDEDNDGLLDLWLTRLETISVGNIFLWLAVAGSVDTETFIYKNTGREFAKRPHRKVTVTLEFPSLFRSADLVMNAAQDIQQVDQGRAIFARLGGRDEQRDVIRVDRQGITVFLDAAAALENQLFMGATHYSATSDAYTVDLADTLRNPALGKDDQRRLVSAKQPSFVIPVVTANTSLNPATADLAAVELNGDGVDDIFVVSERAADKLTGWLLMSAPDKVD